MIHWKEEIIIETHIENVWELFFDKNIKKIMPKVEEHVLIEKKEGEVGAKHQQKYREGKRVETYIVETLGFKNDEDQKLKQISFVLGKAFEINLTFRLLKIDDTHTKFIYEGQNKGVNFVGRAMLKLGSEKTNYKVVQEFLQKVKQEAMIQ
ncbi:SRPBCC family protein [Alkalihalobacillus sp. AL-G]|uniref:SRPBCC family protein n=1 Tax=Alkalihalobacillus sp. AL-G TaxID=2926399 RepID=UPI0027295A68|nr:SRPBCC family protein [Alkalihalobacillus sp. AL-G]WLD94176.1 SRPBCC family protein [Alkalihalobacillus sp. AL-G]